MLKKKNLKYFKLIAPFKKIKNILFSCIRLNSKKISKHIFIKKIASFSCFENPKKNGYHNEFMLIDTIKRLMSSPKYRSVEVINNPTRPGSNHREVNYIKL